MIRDETGFTLMELAVVLALMIIISAMLVPSLNYFQNRQGAKTVGQMNSMISQALVAYYGMTGGYPIDNGYSVGNHNDISEVESKKVLGRVYDVTGYRQLQQYSHTKMKMNIHVINQYVVKIDFEKR